ncbi:MAG: hypothetical protein ACUVSQ_02605 [Pseudanabaenaceae cyanobacterium]
MSPEKTALAAAQGRIAAQRPQLWLPQRGEQARQRAEQLAAPLRPLGIDPDRV